MISKDYVKIATDYAKAAIKDKRNVRFGKLVKQACIRFIADLKHAQGKNSRFDFDIKQANQACYFIEQLPHVEGSWDTENVILHASHVLFVVQLFGFRNKDGTRRFTTALFCVARKNAKSFLCSAILLYCFCRERENGAQVVSAATTFDQARIVFGAAKKMIEKTKFLRASYSLEVFSKSIVNYEINGVFKPIHAKASTQDGLNPSHCGIDEIHAHKNHDLLNVLKSAAGARRNPLFIYTTTEGYESPGPWAEIRHFAKQLMSGFVEADHFLVLYYALDDEDKDLGTVADYDFDEKKWIKANPLIEVNPILLKEIRKEAIEAKQMPGRHAEFKIKRLNRPSSTSTGWINLTKWRECNGKIDLDWLKAYPCYGGLDLASTRDLTSFRLVWDIDGVLYTHGWRFVPTSAVENRTVRGLVPYHAWIQSGHLIETGTEVVNYATIEDCIAAAHAEYDIEMIGYDTWNAAQLASKLKERDIEMVEFIQGTKSYHPAMKLLEERYIQAKLVHDNDPVLNWCASNLVSRTDQNMSTAPDKKKSADKIDDMAALLMAIGTMMLNEESSNIYNSRGVIAI